MARILIVEDDQVTSDALAMLLKNAGHQIETTPTGHEALGSIMDHNHDLIVLDLSMPQMNGANVLEVIRSYLRLQSLPVIVWTGMSDGDLVAKAWELKVNSIVPKGAANVKTLLDAVEAALGEKTN